jgi:hypothetical protein
MHDRFILSVESQPFNELSHFSIDMECGIIFPEAQAGFSIVDPINGGTKKRMKP